MEIENEVTLLYHLPSTAIIMPKRRSKRKDAGEFGRKLKGHAFPSSKVMASLRQMAKLSLFLALACFGGGGGAGEWRLPEDVTEPGSRCHGQFMGLLADHCVALGFANASALALNSNPNASCPDALPPQLFVKCSLRDALDQLWVECLGSSPDPEWARLGWR